MNNWRILEHHLREEMPFFSSKSWKRRQYFFPFFSYGSFSRSSVGIIPNRIRAIYPQRMIARMCRAVDCNCRRERDDDGNAIKWKIFKSTERKFYSRNQLSAHHIFHWIFESTRQLHFGCARDGAHSHLIWFVCAWHNEKKTYWHTRSNAPNFHVALSDNDGPGQTDKLFLRMCY